MRLELDILNIEDIRFADRTSIDNRVLYINRRELQEILQEDKRLSQVHIELAHPGEKCRILQVSDVIEPRAKTTGSCEDFPGALGRQGTVGEGGTCVLRGAAVVVSDCSGNGDFASRDPNGDIIDMSGPAAEIGTYGQTHNIVLLPYPAGGVTPQDYRIALKVAGLKTASYLAKAGKDLKSDEMEAYDLPPLTEVAKGLTDLPKVVYIFQLLTLQFQPIVGEPVLYGSNIEGTVPTILHPNEVLDGAVTAPLQSYGVETYVIQNHPIIKELYRRHGQDLCFAGVILTTAPNSVPEYERVANIAANLAKRVLGAHGAILTKTGGGAPELVMARTAQRCEELGIRTALALLHMGGGVSDSNPDVSVIFNTPEADAIVSMGTPFMTLKLPPMERIIGTPASSPGGPSINGEIVRALRWIKGAQSQLGNSKLTAVVT